MLKSLSIIILSSGSRVPSTVDSVESVFVDFWLYMLRM